MTETMISDRVRLACDIATGKVPADPAAPGKQITAAYKDLSCKGRGPWWYRMVYRNGGWTYFSDERLPMGTFRASERRATVHGEVYPGEIVVNHDKGGPVDIACLVCGPDEEGRVLEHVEFSKRRDGNLCFVLPDGSEVVLSNPRR